MPRLPVELIDEILALAVDLGAIKASEVSCICSRWTGFQKFLFRSIALDPFEMDILDLTLPEHGHLISYVEELQVVPRSPTTCHLPGNYDHDISSPFTKFLATLTNPRSLVFIDVYVNWASLSESSLDSLLAVLQRDSFRSLEVILTKPLPSWMLPNASNLTIKFTGYRGSQVLPSLIEGPITDPCSLTHLVLAGNAAIQMMAEFCVHQPDSARVLLAQLDHLGLEYSEGPFGFPIAPFLEDMIVFLGNQLKVLDLDINTGRTPFSGSASAFHHLNSLQQLNIRLTGPPTGETPLHFATTYMPSFLERVLVSSPVTSLSLRVKPDQSVSLGGSVGSYGYPQLLHHVSQQLASDKWHCLASPSILVDVEDSSAEPVVTHGSVDNVEGRPKLKTLLRVTKPLLCALF